MNEELQKLIVKLVSKSYDLGYWTAIWESTPSGVGLDIDQIDNLRDEVSALQESIEKYK